VFSDSEVMVKQMTGEYSCRSPRPLFPELDLSEVGPVARLLDFSISHVRQENNTEATEANGLASSAAHNAQ